MIYQEIDITKELPPDTDDLFIIKYDETDSVDVYTGNEIIKLNSHIKSWLKPVTLDLNKAKEKAKKILDRMAGTTKSIEDYIAIIESYGYVVIKQETAQNVDPIFKAKQVIEPTSVISITKKNDSLEIRIGGRNKPSFQLVRNGISDLLIQNKSDSIIVDDRVFPADDFVAIGHTLVSFFHKFFELQKQEDAKDDLNKG